MIDKIKEILKNEPVEIKKQWEMSSHIVGLMNDESVERLSQKINTLFPQGDENGLTKGRRNMSSYLWRCSVYRTPKR